MRDKIGLTWIMNLEEALALGFPLQVQVPDRRKPLTTRIHYAAEVFLVDTTHGPAVIWLEPFWCEAAAAEACHIAYASPASNGSAMRWVDQQPRYGPKCLAYQKPFVIERLDEQSEAWGRYQEWQRWQARQPAGSDRAAAWRQVETTFSELGLVRLV
jgi:hypothetical protein